MPEPIALISSDTISLEDFSTFLESVGAVLHPDDVYNGRLSKGNQHVWIALEDNNHLNDLLTELEVSGEVDQLEQIKRNLPGKPCTYILLDISKEPGSEQVAVEFVCQFAEKWSSVVYDLRDKVFSIQDLLKLQHNGTGFQH